MSAPNLSRRLTLERATRTPDGAGGFATDWTPLGVLWAAVEPGESRASGAAAGTLSVVPLRITVRAAPPGAPSRPVAGQRFREGVRTYPIAAVREADPSGRFLLCTAHEEAAL